MTKLFITSTLPYANSYRPHIGHLFEFILADSITRFNKSFHSNENVFFNTGLDQNGSKILQKATELGLPIGEFLSGVTDEWKSFCEKFYIDYNNFYETSSNKHTEKVIKVWNLFIEKGLLYEKEYTGKYCVGCEAFKLNKDLTEGKCPDHSNLTLETVTEKNYFFNLANYKEIIIEWLKINPINPTNKVTELLVFINDYDEISVSRKRTELSLGIGVPNRDDQVIYVWFDALLNYIFAADEFADWNDCETIQLCGPDNLRFQGQIFQCLLLALGKKNTGTLFVHGTILDKNGRKMSKTEGNVIDPIEQIEKYNLHAVRYYTLAGLNTTSNSSWDESNLVTQYNSEVCNDWGNLVSRVLHLIDTKLNGKINEFIYNDFIKYVSNCEKEIHNLWINLQIKEALQKTNELVKFANKYINDETPWNNENHQLILDNLYFLICIVGELYRPVFPNIDIYNILRTKKKIILFDKIIS
jgi:methionyl-tRNA synthetase